MKVLKKIIAVVAIPLILFVVFSSLAGGFGLNSLPVILNQSLIPLIIGYGMSLCLTAGMFDLSAGCQIVLAGVLGGYLAQVWGPAGLVIGCILSGLMSGTLIGIVYRVSKIPSMVVSLGMVLIIEVISRILVGNDLVMKVSLDVGRVGNGIASYIIAVIASVIFYLIYYRTKFASHLKALGNDELVAKSMGVKTDRVKMLSFTVSGFFFGLAAILQICYAGATTVQLNMHTINMAFKPIMGVLIGLQLLSVFDNMLVGVFVGEFSISMIFTGLIAMGLPATTQNVFLGIFMIIVVSVSTNSAAVKNFMRRAKLRKRNTQAA